MYDTPPPKHTPPLQRSVSYSPPHHQQTYPVINNRTFHKNHHDPRSKPAARRRGGRPILPRGGGGAGSYYRTDDLIYNYVQYDTDTPTNYEQQRRHQPQSRTKKQKYLVRRSSLPPPGNRSDSVSSPESDIWRDSKWDDEDWRAKNRSGLRRLAPPEGIDDDFVSPRRLAWPTRDKELEKQRQVRM